MGVDTRIYLPPDVRVDDVAKVLGIIAGLKPSWHTSSPTCRWVTVPGVEVKPTTVPRMPEIHLRGKMVGDDWITVTFHYEPDGDPMRLLLPRSDAFWIAAGRKLVRFFGGHMMYQDIDDKVNYQALRPRPANNPSTGQPWRDFQEDMMRVRPLTLKQIKQFAHHAA
jgi:hypothetical protein